MSRIVKHTTALSLILMVAGCEVGPDYHRPPPVSPPAAQYKEISNWVVAQPADATPKGNWWTDFHDQLLDQLEPQVQVSNQNVQAAYQNYLSALALVEEADSELYPVIGATGSVTRAQSHSGIATGNFTNTNSNTNTNTNTNTAISTTSSGNTINVITQGSVQGMLSWTPDIWGAVRRTIEAQEANAEASEATLANATLSAQITLAVTVINLRVTDAAIDLLTKTVKEYKESYRVVSNGVKSGYSLYPPSDEITARVQLENAQASLVALGVARAQYVHALAVLVGKNPEDLNIAHNGTLPTLPQIPVGVPATLLQRRPDIAAAERTMAAQNAEIGVAISAYYPNISLTAAGGVSQTPLGALFSASNTIWSLGATGAETLIDFGARAAEVESAKATFQSAVATYRATVLSAFQGVEDNLAALRITGQQAEILKAAAKDAQHGAQVARNENMAGIVDYTTVATAEITELTDEQNALNAQQNLLIDAVDLIGDLGGGWSATELHDANNPHQPAKIEPPSTEDNAPTAQEYDQAPDDISKPWYAKLLPWN